jgi:hypothetical protein
MGCGIRDAAFRAGAEAAGAKANLESGCAHVGSRAEPVARDRRRMSEPEIRWHGGAALGPGLARGRGRADRVRRPADATCGVATQVKRAKASRAARSADGVSRGTVSRTAPTIGTESGRRTTEDATGGRTLPRSARVSLSPRRERGTRAAFQTLPAREEDQRAVAPLPPESPRLPALPTARGRAPPL